MWISHSTIDFTLIFNLLKFRLDTYTLKNARLLDIYQSSVIATSSKAKMLIISNHSEGYFNK